mmetsp:Transcript_46708/g.134539  ORF Transcript_46708/g.134539 Transcript_46708/m.134539 type:complete len:315 (-) Transcript_46708:241-1185(-)
MEPALRRRRSDPGAPASERPSTSDLPWRSPTPPWGPRTPRRGSAPGLRGAPGPWHSAAARTAASGTACATPASSTAPARLPLSTCPRSRRRLSAGKTPAPRAHISSPPPSRRKRSIRSLRCATTPAPHIHRRPPGTRPPPRGRTAFRQRSPAPATRWRSPRSMTLRPAPPCCPGPCRWRASRWPAPRRPRGFPGPTAPARWCAWRSWRPMRTPQLLGRCGGRRPGRPPLGATARSCPLPRPRQPCRRPPGKARKPGSSTRWCRAAHLRAPRESPQRESGPSPAWPCRSGRLPPAPRAAPHRHNPSWQGRYRSKA